MVKTCEVLAQQGLNVNLLTPRFRRLESTRVHDYYGINGGFVVTFYPFPDVVSYLFSLGVFLRRHGWSSQTIFSPILFRFAFFIDQFFCVMVLCFLLCFRSRRVIIYTRNGFLAWVFKMLGFPSYFDMHGFPYRLQYLWRWLLRRLNGITVTNRWKAQRCHKHFGLPNAKILVAPNGFDSAAYRLAVDRAAFREELGAATYKHLALYTGHLYDWKGAHVFAAAAALIPEVSCVFIGGTTEDQKKLKDLFVSPNIMVLGRRPHYQISFYLRAADVLVNPNPGWSQNARLAHFAVFDTSPIKLFEYMASGVPVVATDLPSTREVLSADEAVLVVPNDAESLASGIRWVISHTEEARQKAERAKRTVEQYSWQERGRKIKNFFEHTI